jgi:hypothetical protein
MSKKVKEKVALAMDSHQKNKKEQAYKCPLRCWDIFVMLKEEIKQKK